MNPETPDFPNPPIVEAIFDIDCDLPPKFDLVALEDEAREGFLEGYPKPRKQFVREVGLTWGAEKSTEATIRDAVQALQFVSDDERQLVQVRAQGYSFNRLAPYSSLDAYLPEIERTWRTYIGLAKPVETRLVRLRYINRILLPLEAGRVELDDFLTIGPRLADEEALRLTGFLIQQGAIEMRSGHEASLVLTAQAAEGDKLPVILDIGVAHHLKVEPGDWPAIRRTADSLRGLKNRIFFNTLTQRCQQLFL